MLLNETELERALTGYVSARSGASERALQNQRQQAARPEDVAFEVGFDGCGGCKAVNLRAVA